MIKSPRQQAASPLWQRGAGGIRQRGFTLIELIVVIIILSVLMGTFLNRIYYYQERAEKTAMEGVAAAVQSALTMQYGRILIHGKPADVPALAQGNPMAWLQKKPPNYAGEFYDPMPQSVAAGSWIFDLKTHDLIYVLNNASYFTPGKDGKKWVRFHVAINHEAPPTASSQGAPLELTGALFEPVEPYVWF